MQRERKPALLEVFTKEWSPNRASVTLQPSACRLPEKPRHVYPSPHHFGGTFPRTSP